MIDGTIGRSVGRGCWPQRQKEPVWVPSTAVKQNKAKKKKKIMNLRNIKVPSKPIISNSKEPVMNLLCFSGIYLCMNQK